MATEAVFKNTYIRQQVIANPSFCYTTYTTAAMFSAHLQLLIFILALAPSLASAVDPYINTNVMKLDMRGFNNMRATGVGFSSSSCNSWVLIHGVTLGCKHCYIYCPLVSGKSYNAQVLVHSDIVRLSQALPRNGAGVYQSC